MTAAAALALAGASLSGCEVPTEFPQWDTHWVIPAGRTSIPVAALVAGDLSESEGGETFEFDLPAISVTRSLGELCEVCRPLDGFTVPKPPFTISAASNTPIPAGVISATLAAGTLQLQIRHDLSFDPLRPGGGERGFLTISAVSGASVLARDSLSGNDVALPPGGVFRHELRLRPATVAGPIEVRMTLHSPAGDPVTIDLDHRLTLEVPPAVIRLTNVRLRFTGREVSSSPIVLELHEIDGAVSARLQSGAVLLEVANPFELTAELELRITAGKTVVVKSFEIVPGNSEIRIALSGEEIRSIVGQPQVVLLLNGRVTSSPGGTAVEPGDEIGFGARLELVVASRRTT